MKFKHCYRYVEFIIVISCITLLSIKSTNNINSDITGRSRFIIKSTEKAHIPYSKENGSSEGIRTSSSQSGYSGVQLLPTPNNNSKIILTPLSPAKL